MKRLFFAKPARLRASIDAMRGWGQKGASLVEYAMAVGLISVASIGAVYSTGTEVKTVFCVVNTEIRDSMGWPVQGDCHGGTPVAEGPGGTGGGEGSGGGSAPGASGTPGSGGSGPGTGGGEGGEGTTPSVPDAEAQSPEQLMLAFRDVSLSKGFSRPYRTLKTANITPPPGYVFSVQALGDVSMGTYSACLGDLCASATGSGVSSLTVPASSRFQVGYRFTPSGSALAELDVPLRLTLTSAADGSQSWTQDIHIRRPASSVGVASLNVRDLVYAAGAYNALGAGFGFHPEGVGDWTATLTRVPSPTDTGNLSYYLRVGSSNTTVQAADGPVTLDFAASAGSYLSVYGLAPAVAERYDAIHRTFELTLVSKLDPSVSVTETFTISRPLGDAATPKIAANGRALLMGRAGTATFSFNYTGDPNATLAVDLLESTDVPLVGVGVDALCVQGNSGCSSTWNAASPVRSINLGANKGGRIGLVLPGGDSMARDQHWVIRLTATSSFDPSKSSVTDVVMTRAGATGTANLAFSDILLGAGQTSIPKQTQATGVLMPLQVMMSKEAADTAVALRICSLVPQTSYEQCAGSLTAANDTLSISATAPAGRRGSMSLEGAILGDPYAAIDLPITVTAQMLDAPSTQGSQTIRIQRPAIEVTPPSVEVPSAQLAWQAVGTTTTIPFSMRYKDTARVSFEHVSGTVIGLAANSTLANQTDYAAVKTIGQFNLAAPLTQGNIQITAPGANSPQKYMDFSSVYDMVVAPRQGSGFDAEKATRVRLTLSRDLPSPDLSGFPSSLNIPAGSSSPFATSLYPVVKAAPGETVLIRWRRVSGTLEGDICFTTCANKWATSTSWQSEAANAASAGFRFRSPTTIPAGQVAVAEFEVELNYNGYYTKPRLYRIVVTRTGG